MKLLVALALFVAVAMARPGTPDGDAQIVEHVYDSEDNAYRYKLQTSNGIQAEEEGVIADPGTENEGIEVRGQFSYTGQDGKTYLVTYTAGRDGFRPAGDHIPQ